MNGTIKSAAGFVCCLGFLCPVSDADAQMGKGKKWETFPLTCAASTFTITASPGQWSVGHIVDSKGRPIVPYTFSITITNRATGDVLYTASYRKPGNRGGDPVRCSSHTETTDPETGVPIVIDFESLVHIRGG